ncbi:hypothetical protein CPB86DRAFT_701418 [Serendipita vermifera]|nr:hypothetical protein CPB86DRAFT_701418 [Serendipita vermifera]
MLRRDPTLIQIDQNAVKEVQAALKAKAEAEGTSGQEDSMLVDATDDSIAAKQPYNVVEEQKKRLAAMSRNQRMGIAD